MGLGNLPSEGWQFHPRRLMWTLKIIGYDLTRRQSDLSSNRYMTNTDIQGHRDLCGRHKATVDVVETTPNLHVQAGKSTPITAWWYLRHPQCFAGCQRPVASTDQSSNVRRSIYQQKLNMRGKYEAPLRVVRVPPITFSTCSSHVTTYFRTFIRTFESVLWRGSNIRGKVIAGTRSNKADVITNR